MIAKLVDVENNQQCHKVLDKVEFRMNNTKNRSLSQYSSVDSLKENFIDESQEILHQVLIRLQADICQKKAQGYNKNYVDSKRQKPQQFLKEIILLYEISTLSKVCLVS